MANPGEFFKSFEQYKSLLAAIVKAKLADKGSEDSEADVGEIIQNIRQNKHIEIHAYMALLDIDSPDFSSQEYKGIEEIVELYTGMHILKQQKLRAEQTEQARKLAEYQRQARQSLESESLTVKKQALIDTELQVEQDLVRFKQEQDLSQKAAKLEEVLRINFGKTFADLVAANNERFIALTHPEHVKVPEQYSSEAKISRILYDINKLQQEQFNKLCQVLIDNRKTSHKDKKLITDLQAMVSAVFDVVATDGSLNSVYTNRWQKFVAVANSEVFQSKLQQCNPSIKQKFLDICLLILSLGLVKPQNSAEKFVKSTKQILSISAQINKILHGHPCGSGVTVVPGIPERTRKRDRVVSRLYRLHDHMQVGIKEQALGMVHKLVK